ncbi:MAG: ATPase, T2SS/T4P/T4SS family, partial [Acidobacteriota bacterium]
MENLNEYLQTLVNSGSSELRLEPNKEPYVISASGNTNIGAAPLQGTQISMMVFPLIPPDIKNELPDKSEIEFTHPHALCRFEFVVKKSPAGFIVTVRPDRAPAAIDSLASPGVDASSISASPAEPAERSTNSVAAYGSETISIDGNASKAAKPGPKSSEVESSSDMQAQAPAATGSSLAADSVVAFDFDTKASGFFPPAEEYIPKPEPGDVVEEGREIAAVQLVERRKGDRREVNSIARDRMDALFRKMADIGASDMHLSASVPPIVRRDGRMDKLECNEQSLEPDVLHELLFSIMPPKNREEFTKRNDTDFAYEIPGLARIRCNVFTDRKGPGGVFRIAPTKILTAEQLGLPKAVMDLCSLSKGLVMVTGPAGSGRSTTLCAMVDWINKSREDHIITIEDPIEFIHENKKCLVNQREVNNHTDSFKDAMRAALREDPDVLLVGEMRDLE